MNRPNGYRLICLVAVMLFFCGLWVLDISTSALLAGGWLANGFWIADPVKMYHVGIYLMSASVIYLGSRLIDIEE